MNDNYKYKFSIIIPIYNVEEYLEETILSVVNQTIGFEENIQMILVNDGSPDNSEVICKKYLEKYPENVVYIKQENGGVSSARNNGINYVEGKYVNFLDSDDKWPLNAFEKVWKFFEKNYSLIDVVACRLKYFEAMDGYSHPLNFKFTKDRIVQIEFDYNHIQMHMASCFIKSSKINHFFSTKLKYAEDSLFINQIILQKQRYGVMKSVDYLYRKRANESSAIDTCQQKVEFYESTLTHFHDVILEYAKDKFKEIPYYVQSLIMYDLQWRIKRPIPDGVLTNEEKECYINHIKLLLKNIENFLIMEQKNIWVEHKVYALNLKHDYDVRKTLSQKQNELFYKNLKVFNIKSPSLIKIEKVDVYNEVAHIEGFVNIFLNEEDYKIYFEDSKKNIYYIKDICNCTKRKKYCLEGDYYCEKYFKIDIPIEDDSLKINIKFVYKNNFPRTTHVSFTGNCNLNDACRNSYFKTNDFFILCKEDQLIFRKKTLKGSLALERNLIKEIWNNKSKKIALYRLTYQILNNFIKKDIWIISDRPDKAGDNGEAFFRYLVSIKDKNIKPYFVLKKDSEDYKKMKKIGNVLVYDSLKYKLYMLFSKHVISSQASDYIINPFGKMKKFVADLYTFKFTFLQHGITKDDISDWLNKSTKNIDCFIAAGKPEYESFVNGEYYFDKDVFKLTGFPRHDNLLKMNDQKKKKILIIPTWRKSLSQCVDPKTDTSVYYEGFKDSEFFKFYNDLINDTELLKCMKKYGYEGLFCLHPLFSKQNIDFNSNDVFKINEGYVDYQKEFAEGALLVTDYSSVFFDFGYLKKPVVYAQFDKNTFFEEHSYHKGYFSYTKDGFGPVCHTYYETINEIITAIKNDCKTEEKYLNNIENFYIDADGKNSERIYKILKQM